MRQRHRPAWPAYPAGSDRGRPPAARLRPGMSPRAPAVARSGVSGRVRSDAAQSLGLRLLISRAPAGGPTGTLQLVKAIKAIDVDHAIQMVDLVLECLPEQSLRVRDADLLAVGVASLD